MDDNDDDKDVKETEKIDFGTPLELRSRLEILSYVNATGEYPDILNSKQVAAVCGGVFRSISGHSDEESCIASLYGSCESSFKN